LVLLSLGVLSALAATYGYPRKGEILPLVFAVLFFGGALFGLSRWWTLFRVAQRSGGYRRKRTSRHG